MGLDLSLAIINNKTVFDYDMKSFYDAINELTVGEQNELYELREEIFGNKLFSKKFRTYRNFYQLKIYFLITAGKEIINGIIKVDFKELKKIKKMSKDDSFLETKDKLYQELKRMSTELNEKKVWKRLKKHKNNIYLIYS